LPRIHDRLLRRTRRRSAPRGCHRRPTRQDRRAARDGDRRAAVGSVRLSGAVRAECSRERLTWHFRGIGLPREARWRLRNAAMSHGSWEAGGGNRTLITSLEGWGSTIELHPRSRRATLASPAPSFVADAGSTRAGTRARRARACCPSGSLAV